MLNIDIKRGFLCEDAQVFLSRTGKPKICFRMGVPRDRTLPQKQPVSADFFSVVMYGDKYLDLLPLLTAGQEVLTIGITQSRDMSDGSVTTEILAREIIVFPDENAQRIALAQFLAAELEADRRQYGDAQWSPNDLGQWIAGKLRAPPGELVASGSPEDTSGEGDGD